MSVSCLGCLLTFAVPAKEAARLHNAGSSWIGAVAAVAAAGRKDGRGGCHLHLAYVSSVQVVKVPSGVSEGRSDAVSAPEANLLHDGVWLFGFFPWSIMEAAQKRRPFVRPPEGGAGSQSKFEAVPRPGSQA